VLAHGGHVSSEFSDDALRYREAQTYSLWAGLVERFNTTEKPEQVGLILLLDSLSIISDGEHQLGRALVQADHLFSNRVDFLL